MRTKLATLTLVMTIITFFQTAAQTVLKVGDKAPDFASKDQDGKLISLSDFRGKKVVLYFYPKDQTPGCTKQACNLRNNHSDLADAGYTVLGVSPDNESSHREFADMYFLPFTLIADTDKSVHKKYGTWVEKKSNEQKSWGTARTTFVIDENGVITEIIRQVDTSNHADQILGK